MAVLGLRLTLLAGATMLAACGASSSSGGPQHSTTAAAAPAARGDAFNGTITAGTGRFSGERGGVAIALSHPPRVGDASTSMTLSIVGAACGGQARCLQLSGRLSGRMTAQHSLADVGHRFELAARGTVSPLGQVQGRGIAAGTGFIRTGRTALIITLRSAGGTITIEGQSRPVPGRTDP